MMCVSEKFWEFFAELNIATAFFGVLGRRVQLARLRCFATTLFGDGMMESRPKCECVARFAFRRFDSLPSSNSVLSSS